MYVPFGLTVSWAVCEGHCPHFYVGEDRICKHFCTPVDGHSRGRIVRPPRTDGSTGSCPRFAELSIGRMFQVGCKYRLRNKPWQDCVSELTARLCPSLRILYGRRVPRNFKVKARAVVLGRLYPPAYNTRYYNRGAHFVIDIVEFDDVACLSDLILPLSSC